MHRRTIANLILLTVGVTLVIALLYGIIAVFLLVIQRPPDSLTTVHRIGITILALALAILIVGALADLLFAGTRARIPNEQLNKVSASLSFSYPVRQLLASHEAISCEAIEEKFAEVCRRLENIYKTDEEKRRHICKAQESILSEFPEYGAHARVALARLSSSIGWVPKPPELLLILVKTNDLGALGQLMYKLRRLDHPLAEVAELRWRQEWSRTIKTRPAPETSKIPLVEFRLIHDSSPRGKNAEADLEAIEAYGRQLMCV